MRSLLTLISIFLMTSCMPEFLAKYQRDAVGPLSPSSPVEAARPSDSMSPIYALDQSIFRFHLPFDLVWDSALNVLMKNYNITIVDRDNGIITTEWDSFYIKTQLYRNKISFRMKGLTRSLVEVSIYNNVEMLKSPLANESFIWVPFDKGSNEVTRLVHNMALVLNRDPPILPAAEVSLTPPDEHATVAK